MRLLPVLLALAACTPPIERGPTTSFTLSLANTSAPGAIHTSDGNVADVTFAPGIVIVHDATFALVTPGAAATGVGVEALAEDGDPTALEAALGDDPAVFSVVFLRHLDEVTYDAAPMEPGDDAVTAFDAADGDLVTVAFMYGQSNDVLIATGDPVPAFTGGTPTIGDWTAELALWDLGTEVNQEPGLGPDQAPRQAAANTGAAEDGVVTEIPGTDADGFTYPAVDAICALSASAG